MSFQLVPKSVTLNDLERRNGRYIASVSSDFMALYKCYYYYYFTEFGKHAVHNITASICGGSECIRVYCIL